MNIDRNFAMKLWEDIYGKKEFVTDCFGSYIFKNGYGNEPFYTKRPSGDGKTHDYSWNVDHIRPKASFENESDADDFNNLEIIHRSNNLEKSDNYPHFTIDGDQYRVVKNGSYGYGIVDHNGHRVDWKKDGRHYE